MTTDTLRALVDAAAATMPGARIWPNGIGFDCHGTQYTYSERIGVWCASRPISPYATKYGEGATPAAAKAAAGIGRKARGAEQ